MSKRNDWRSLLGRALGTEASPEIPAEGREVAPRVDRPPLHLDVVAFDQHSTYVSGWRTLDRDVAFASPAGDLKHEIVHSVRADVNQQFRLPSSFSSGFVARLRGAHASVTVRAGRDLDAPSITAEAVPLESLEPRLAATVSPLVRLEPARLAAPLPPPAAAPEPELPEPPRSVEEQHLQLVRDSGVFDAAWYLASYPDVATAGIDPLLHFFFRGGHEGRDPSYLFRCAWYLERNPEVTTTGLNPLVHYLLVGEREGRQPSVYFDPTHYRSQLGDASVGSLLGHYLREGFGRLSPNDCFDTRFYLEHQSDVRAAGIDPLKHFIDQGWNEEREIHREFSFLRYRDRLARRFGAAIEPLSHYLRVGREAGERLPRRLESADATDAAALLRQLQKNTARGEHFEERLIGSPRLLASVTTRLFAFYLPQFHAFAENDAWWGKGFTEWTNVTRALPRFVGHQQPRRPRDLGYYDLLRPEVMREQAALARAAGVTGFCFYYYWFDGKRLLDAPVERFLADASIDLPFCLMWANENWTRRWDGFESDILIEQSYRDEDDDTLIDDFARHFADARYERVDGRPLLFVYRPGIIPHARERIARWRAMFESLHGERPWLLMVQGFGDVDPDVYGLDGAIEFPPHKLADGVPPVNGELELFDADFAGHMMRYDDLVEKSHAVSTPAYPLIRTLVPSWDNEARKPSRGMGFVDSTPAKYEAWLRQLISWANDHPVFGTGRYVFVNAWNEWAEGAFLEPDTHHGVAYLNATTRALTGISTGRKVGRRVVLVGHDAYLHGAQLLTLNILRTLTRRFGMQVEVVLMRGGPLLDEYRRHANVRVLDQIDATVDEVLDQLDVERGKRLAICNTTVTGDIVERLAARGYRVVSLVHELPRLIEEYGLEARAQAIAKHAERVVFAAESVRAGFEGLVGPLGDKAVLRPQGIYQRIDQDRSRRDSVRETLGVPAAAKLVMNLGYADLRKGFDLFLEVARSTWRDDPSVHFLWVGDVQADLATWSAIDRRRSPFTERFHQVPFEDDVAQYLAASDAMALTSREDPFPSTVLEALATGLPVVAFEDGGGYVDAIGAHARNGSLVPMADTRAMADALREVLAVDSEAARDARAADARTRYDWADYVFDLLRLANPGLAKVSVVVPNYRYANYLPDRLASILGQEYPIYELIVLDDASPDESVIVAREVLDVARRDATLVVNDSNSGSVFRQWEKGVRLATGDLVWIAEADDSSQPTFLADLLARFDDETTLGFTDSRQVDQDDRVLGESYRFYFDDLDDPRMGSSFSSTGPDFVEHVLAIKNVILNVSAVVFRRETLERAFDRSADEVRGFKVAGDWRLYCELLSDPASRIVYVDAARNVHRRHASSVTRVLEVERHLREIETVQRYAAEVCTIPTDVVVAAAKYLDQVRRQFESATRDDA